MASMVRERVSERVRVTERLRLASDESALSLAVLPEPLKLRLAKKAQRELQSEKSATSQKAKPQLMLLCWVTRLEQAVVQVKGLPQSVWQQQVSLCQHTLYNNPACSTHFDSNAVAAGAFPAVSVHTHQSNAASETAHLL